MNHLVFLKKEQNQTFEVSLRDGVHWHPIRNEKERAEKWTRALQDANSIFPARGKRWKGVWCQSFRILFGRILFGRILFGGILFGSVPTGQKKGVPTPGLKKEIVTGMVGAVVVTHSRIGERLIETAEYIVGEMSGIIAVSLDLETNAFEARRRIAEAMKHVNQGNGVLILTDLFGGSPSNIAHSFLNSEKVDVITGVNLPMIITFWNKREGRSLAELAKSIQLSGLRSILRARDLMERKVDFRKTREQ